MADFSIFGRIALQGAKEFNAEIDKVRNKSSQAATGLDNSFKKIGRAVAAAFSVTAVVNFSKAIVDAAAEIHAREAQFEATFKEIGDAAEDTFNRISESTGIMATRLQTAGTKAFAQFRGAGLEANEALAQTENYLNLAADAAAYYDMSLEDADVRLRSFLRGNVEAGDAIGLFTNETQRNDKALELYGEKYVNLNEQQRQMVMLDIASTIYEQSGAIGQAARESEEYANVSGNLAETWKLFKAELGEQVLEALIPVLQDVTEWLTEMRERVSRLNEWIENNRDTIDEWIARFKALAAGIGTALAVVAGFKAAAGLVVGFQNVLNGLSANPFMITVAAIAAVTAALVTLYNQSADFRAFWQTVVDMCGIYWTRFVEFIERGVEDVAAWFQGLWDSISDIYSGVATWFTNIFTDAWNGIKGAFNSAKTWFEDLWEKIKSVFVTAGTAIGDAVSTAFKAAVNGVLTVVESVINGFVSAINFVLKGASAVSEFVGLGSIKTLDPVSLPRLENGGVAKNTGNGTLAVVGENGAEAIIPLEKSKFTDEFAARIAEKINSDASSRASGMAGMSETSLVFRVNRNQEDLAKLENDILDLGATTEEWATSSENARARLELLQEQQSAQLDTLAALKAAYDLEVKNYGTSSDRANDLRVEMAALESQMLDTEESITHTSNALGALAWGEEAAAKAAAAAGEGGDLADALVQPEKTKKDLGDYLGEVSGYLEGTVKDIKDGFNGYWKTEKKDGKEITTWVEGSIQQGMAAVSTTFEQLTGFVDSYITPFFEAIMGYQNQTLENEIAVLEETLEAKKEAYEEDHDDYEDSVNDQKKLLKQQYHEGQISYAQYVAACKKLNDELTDYENANTEEQDALETEIEQKKDQLAREQFEANKKTQIATALINGAQAAILAFAQLGPIAGAIAAIAVAATTAAQIATISSQQYTSAFAKGGIVDKPTVGLVGEAGTEAVVPLENNLGWVERLRDVIAPVIDDSIENAVVASRGLASAESGYDMGVISKLEDGFVRLEEKFDELIAKDTDVYLDSNTLAGATAARMDINLGRRTRLKNRGL